jgi:anti-sigma regulatory factor (Ser/Thr protein kinase)
VVEAASSGRTVHVYSDLVARLWNHGEIVAAVEMERLWFTLGEAIPLVLYCPYPAQLAAGGTGSLVLQRVYDHQADIAEVPGLERLDPDVHAAAEFSADWSAPGSARRWAQTVLGRWRLADDELLDDAALVVTELANNAVLHARSPFTVGVRTEDHHVCLSVRDASLSMPALGSPGVMDRFGRGLGMVAALSSSWGVDADDAGKVVWARLAGTAN